MIDATHLAENLATTITDAVAKASKRLDVTQLDLSAFDVTNLNLPKFDLPKFDLPKLDLPTFDVPLEVDRVADLVRDVTYAGIGMWVVAAQKVDAEVRKLATKAA